MSFLSKIFLGYDLDEEQQRGDTLDAQLNQINSVDYAPGGQIYQTISERSGTTSANQAYQDEQQHLADSQTGNVTDQVQGAFGEGLQEGYANVTGGISAALKAPFKFAWDSIPWQVWLLGLGVLFFYLGGFAWLARIIRGKFNA